MAISRSRSMSTPSAPGQTWTFDPNLKETYARTLNQGTCIDVVGARNAQNPLTIETHSSSLVLLNRTEGLNQFARKFSSFPVMASDCNHAPATHGPTGWSPKLKSASRQMANTHPGEPAVSLPNFLFELKDFAPLFKKVAIKLNNEIKAVPLKPASGKQASDAYLQYTFGWAPFVNDLLELFKVSEWTARRARQIRNIRERGFLTRRSSRGSDGTTYSGFTTFESLAGINANYTNVTNVKSWVTTRWGLTNHLPLISSLSDERNRLLVAALGLDVSFETFWNAMPWTWLVDYFTDLSSIISVHDNSQGFQFLGGCIMENWESTRTLYPVGSGVQQYGPVSPVVKKRSLKKRTPFSPSLADLGFNFLSDRQILTLGALTVSRTLR